MEQAKKLNKLLTRENKVCRMVVSQFVSESVNSHTYPGHKRSELLTRQLVNMLRETLVRYRNNLYQQPRVNYSKYKERMVTMGTRQSSKYSS